jgi:hypothetical protein
LKNIFFETTNIIEKLFLSYITNILISFKVHKSLENKIISILFKEKIFNRKDDFVDSLIYFNQIMLKIKEKNDTILNMKLLDFLYKHINNCNNINCNCKLLNVLNKNQKNENIHSNYTSELLIILNHLYESVFLEFDYYNRIDMVILLAEHFCHLKDNPIMSFSLINSLLINHKNILSKMQILELYELNQKYIYYIWAREKCDKVLEITENDNDILVKVNRETYYKYYFNVLTISNKIKKNINKYIGIILDILKNKNLFEETLAFKIDENNGEIIFVKLKLL